MRAGDVSEVHCNQVSIAKEAKPSGSFYKSFSEALEENVIMKKISWMHCVKITSVDVVFKGA